jgi:hypothetical protein
MEQDFHAEEIERRYNETVERGTVQGDTFITPSGASVPMLAPQPDDNELEDSGCVYCDGEGIWREEMGTSERVTVTPVGEPEKLVASTPSANSAWKIGSP